jgi:hypothetical protein
VPQRIIKKFAATPTGFGPVPAGIRIPETADSGV